MSKEMRGKINTVKNFSQFLNENVKMEEWILFDNSLLSSEQIESVNKYSVISDTKPKGIFIQNNKIMVSFGPKIYSLTKEQIVKLAEIDFLEYNMDDYNVSVITFTR